MHRQVGDLRFGDDGLARRGLLVRHLVMPNHVEDALKIFKWLANEISPDTYVNIMDQYRPLHQVGKISKYDAINRRPSATELDKAFAAARQAGLWRFDERR
jgi:putative pyruvate formate lyase activating enzyme